MKRRKTHIVLTYITYLKYVYTGRFIESGNANNFSLLKLSKNNCKIRHLYILSSTSVPGSYYEVVGELIFKKIGLL